MREVYKQSAELTNFTAPGDERLIAAVAVEDTTIVFSVATATAAGFKSIEAGAFEYRNQGPEQLKDIFQSFFATRSQHLACVAISLPGTIDTKNALLLDIPRREWDSARERAQGKPLLDFKALFETLGYKGLITADNDTTMAALGERDFQNLGDFAYIRAGLGINAAVLVNGRPWQGALHPEMGHITVRRHERDYDRESTCSFHATCLEGLVAWPAIQNRMNKLGPGHENFIWDMISYYIAQLCFTLTVVFAPSYIVIGGLLLREESTLLDRIRVAFDELHGNYPRCAPFYAPDYIRSARGDVDRASLFGALKAAHENIFGTTTLR